MKKIWNEFKAFALKGNMFDLAVGMVIGTAFTTIVKSIVDDIIMPLVGAISGGVDFTDLGWRIPFGAGNAVVKWGNLLQNFVNFMIVAVCLFFVVKFLSHFKKQEEEKPAKKADDVVLLEEIRDTLQAINEKK